MTFPDLDAADAFVARWADPDGSERSNFQSFAIDLCRILDVETPSESDSDNSAYGFERPITVRKLRGKSTTNFIDLYRRGCFVLEAKQSRKRANLGPAKALELELTGGGRTAKASRGRGWDVLMENARNQAENYAKNLPVEENWPPFIIVVDVGTAIELYADFSLQGKHYAQFPDRQSYRLTMDDLRKPEVLTRLRAIWQDPMSLNLANRTAEITRDVARLLAKLSRAMETRMIRALDEEGRTPEDLALDRRAVAERVALFLMRCLFTMFAEDVGLLKRDSFTERLKSYA